MNRRFIDNRHSTPIPHPHYTLPDTPTPSNSLHPSVKIERAQLSPGMRRDQPGRYARIILRLPHERVAVTGTVAESDVRNVDSLFSSTLLWFQRMLQTPKRPSLQRLLLVVEREILEAARQRHVLLRDSLRERIELFEINDGWTEVSPLKRFERKHLWRKRLARFPPVNEPSANRSCKRNSGAVARRDRYGGVAARADASFSRTAVRAFAAGDGTRANLVWH